MNHKTINNIKERLYWGESNNALSTLVNNDDNYPEVFCVNAIKGKLSDQDEDGLIAQISGTKGIVYWEDFSIIVQYQCIDYDFTITRETFGDIITVRANFKFKKL